MRRNFLVHSFLADFLPLKESLTYVVMSTMVDRVQLATLLIMFRDDVLLLSLCQAFWHILWAKMYFSLLKLISQ